MKKTSEVETEDAKLEHNIREEKLCVEVKKKKKKTQHLSSGVIVDKKVIIQNKEVK